MNNPWTPDLDAQLRQLWAEGKSGNEIATTMGRSKNSIIGRAHRLDLTSRPSPIIRTGPAHPPKPRAPAPNSAAAVEHARAVGVHVFRRERGPVMVASAVAVSPQTLDPTNGRADWYRGPEAIKRDRLPIPVGPYAPARTCQWPTSDGRPWTFCGCASVPGRSYCAEHVRRAFKTIQELRDEPAHEPTPAGRVGMNARSWA